MKGLSWLQKRALRKSIARVSLPIEERWRRAGEELPQSEWHSFDRTPWNHPWLQKQNLREFADFSKLKLQELRGKIDLTRPSADRYAFAGNMANLNYIRALPLRRRGLNIDLVLHPHDEVVFAQPAWEELDGESSELGGNPGLRLFQEKLPDWVHRPPVEPDWLRLPFQVGKLVATPEQILLWPECMPFFPTLATLSQYDSLLVSQFPYLGFLSGRPYLFQQNGGDIWFEASRNDAFGILTRRAVAASYAVLVSNPITLAHARRYGLKNLLYVPWPLDEAVYCPGDSGELRSEWKSRIGGDFFVLTSMRMDRHWKGAHHALDGFVRFAAAAPQARLLVLGWGNDLKFAEDRVNELGLSDRVLFLPTVGKRRLVRYLRAADVLIEQFVLGYYGASGLEAMACGKPVIMRLERDQYEGLIDVGAPPVLDADDGAGVAKQLRRLYDDPALCSMIGDQTRKWFLSAQSSERWFETYRILLQAMASGIPLSYDDSPLRAPLSGEELSYHAEQLSGAPPFPHYVDP